MAEVVQEVVGFIPEVFVKNIVASADVGCYIDLNVLHNATDSEYSAENFRAVKLFYEEHDSSVSVFESGVLLVDKSRSLTSSQTVAMITAAKIKELGFQVNLGKLEIRNIVCTFNTGFYVNLEQMFKKYKRYCRYQLPPNDSKLVFYLGSPKSTVFINGLGEIMLIGLRSEEEVYRTIAEIFPILEEFEETDSVQDSP